jgi:hypothetical protein
MKDLTINDTPPPPGGWPEDSVSPGHGSAHDPLCFIEHNPLMRQCSICDLIAKVREEQRIGIEAVAYLAQRDMLAKCIAAVEFLHDNNPDQATAFWYAICELRALQEKP